MKANKRRFIMQWKKMCGVAIFGLVLCSAFCGGSFADEGGRFILPQYSQKVSLDFKNADLKDILKAFSKQLGTNFLVAKDVDIKAVTVFLDKVPVEDALEKILSANGLDYEYDEAVNVFTVKTKAPSLDERIITRVFQLKFASLKDSSIAKSLSSDVEKSIGTVGGDSDTSSASSTSTEGSADTDEVGVVAIIKSILKNKESGKVVQDTRTNSIIVTDVQSNFPNIERVLARIDVPVAQVLIEVEMLDVSKNTTDEMGVRFGTLFQVNGALQPTALPWDQTAANENGFSYNFSTTTASTVTSSAGSTYAPGAVDFSGVSMMVQFLKSKADTKSLARPRIMTLDNQTAQIRIATNEAIGVRDVSTSSGSSTQTAIEAERVDTGILLTVTPQISLLTDEITLVVEPKVIQARAGGTFITSTGRETTFKDPEERAVKSILKVKNGDTIMIGGLLRSDEGVTVTKVPLLGDIPLLGSLFRYRSMEKGERELIVFLTPRIMDGASGNIASTVSSSASFLSNREQRLPDSRGGLIDKTMDQMSGQRR